MSRRLRAVAALAALLTMATALPGLPSPAAAASCSGWTSQSAPPTTIRVFRHSTGAVDTVNFKAYTKNVLSREWIASWTTESLRSGALAVKSYAWYQVLHWRGGTNAGGACFDVRDDTYDQVYDPSKPTYTTAAAAVDATWTTRVLKNGQIFPTYYNAGASGEACGANANGWKMYQWGTQTCGLAGKTAAQIMLTYYYPGVTVTSAPAPTATPTPTPVATPSPTPAATATAQPTASPTAGPSSPSPTQTPRPTASPSPKPTPVPTARPSPTPSQPLATPPPSQPAPGGGQSGVVNAPSP
ncbi:MAG TPA: SpoIID/LytB domain-containing protein, partial [Candidatus Limnocylindria bacterium]|nr:SpoIID/LytB domain-containing protein [Candidatus Limnocylindria bacterium]